MRDSFPITNEAAWLEGRRRDLTSTDAAALCGVSKWKSRYQLWHEKVRGEIVAREETPSMRLGKRMEAPIAEHIAAENGMEIEPFKHYMRMPDVRLGSSFDYIARDRSFLFEIKLVGNEAFRSGWVETDFGLEAPIEVEAQVQQEMLLAEIPLAFTGVMCGTDTYLLRREFDQAVADRLQREAANFWTMPEPTPDFTIDAEFISRLYGQSAPGKTINATTRLAELIIEYDETGKQIREFDKHREAVRAEIFTLAPDAERIEFDGGYALAKTQAECVVESFTRKSSRPLRVYGRKDK